MDTCGRSVQGGCEDESSVPATQTILLAPKDNSTLNEVINEPNEDKKCTGL